MDVINDRITTISSLILRLTAYVFLRWIPGHHCVPVAYTAFITWLVSFVWEWSNTEPYEIINDEIDIIVKEPVDAEVNGEPVDDIKLLDGAEDGPLKELDVAETVTYRLKRPERLWTLTWGAPSPSSILWSTVTAAINFALIGMVTDRLYTPQWFHQSHDLAFARVGYVSASTADILIREPRAEQLPIFVSMRAATPVEDVALGYPELDTSFRAVGSISRLGNATDYTANVKITQLRPDTRYQYLVSNNHSGYFTTAPPIGQTPVRNGGKFTFLHSSCIKARFPYSPFEHALSIDGLRHLSKWIPTLKAQFMLFLGDFIYIDVPWRFGVTAETYRREYRMVYSSPDWPAATRDLPWIHVYDDHEIANDWDNGTGGVYDSAFDAFRIYQSSVNPPTYRGGADHSTYYSFTQGPASFFMLDTRRYRSKNFADDVGKTMLGQQQLADLLFWLRAGPSRGVKWKFVISSVPFTKNWRLSGNDTWGAFLSERQQILEAMWDSTAKGIGVVVLSGDRHEFAATSFSPPEGESRGRKEVLEFSTSPLSMFYLPIQTYVQRDDDDVMVKYIPTGNSKFGAVEITAPANDELSTMNYRLFVDGQEAWTYAITSPEVRPWSFKSLFGSSDVPLVTL